MPSDEASAESGQGDKHTFSSAFKEGFHESAVWTAMAAGMVFGAVAVVVWGFLVPIAVFELVVPVEYIESTRPDSEINPIAFIAVFAMVIIWNAFVTYPLFGGLQEVISVDF